MANMLNMALMITAVDRASAVIRNMTDRSTAALGKMQAKTKELSEAGYKFGKDTGAMGLAVAAPVVGMVKAAADIERLQVALKTSFQGNEAAAKSAFKQIQEFGAKTPYDMEQSMNAFMKLKNLGLTPSMEAMESYGNTASSMGKSLTDMVEAVADASTFEFERLKEFGIKAKQSSDSVAFTFAGQTVKVKKNAADIEKYLMNIGKTKFAGGMDAQSKTVYGQLSTMQDNAKMLAATMGNTLFPAINQVFEKVGPLIDKIQNWITANPELAQTVMLVTVGVAGLLLTMSAFGFLFGGVMQAVSIGSMAFKGLSIAVGHVNTAVSATSKFMLANPWILAIMAIAIAAFLIIKYWGPIKEFFIAMWAKVKEYFWKAVDWVVDFWNKINPGPAIAATWGSITDWFSKLWDRVKAIFWKVVDFVKTWIWYIHPALIIYRHWDDIKNFFSKVWAKVKEIFWKVVDWVKEFIWYIHPALIIYRNWDGIKAYFLGLWERVKEIFNGYWKWVSGFADQFFDVGKNIIEMIGKGIDAAIGKVTDKIKGVTQMIRDHFPFSPAKRGALRDIHKIKLIETIAGSIKVDKLAQVLGAATQKAAAIVPQAMAQPLSVAGQGSRVNIHYNPVVSGVGGNGGSAAYDVRQALMQNSDYITKLVRDSMANQQRTRF